MKLCYEEQGNAGTEEEHGDSGVEERMSVCWKFGCIHATQQWL
jgi:hypothetical protein